MKDFFSKEPTTKTILTGAMLALFFAAMPGFYYLFNTTWGSSWYAIQLSTFVFGTEYGLDEMAMEMFAVFSIRIFSYFVFLWPLIALIISPKKPID